MTERPRPEVGIREALSEADLAACRALFVEYQSELGVSLCFQGFDQELASLPAAYARPRGRLWLATANGQPAGCVAIREIEPGVAEMKRLYVRPRWRKGGLGRRLAELSVTAAWELGYREIRLDTLRTMAAAQRLYLALGFTDVPRYNDNPLADVRFLGLDLAKAPVRS